MAGDANRQPDIFVRDLKTGTTTLISRNAAGTNGGNNRSYAPTISADGMYVSFVSDATDLTNLPDTNNQPDLFSYSFATGKVTLLSTNTAGTAAANAGIQARYRMDDSGLKVAFLSRSEDLMPGTGFDFFSVNYFLKDLAAGTTSLISHGPAGEALGTAGEIASVATDRPRPSLEMPGSFPKQLFPKVSRSRSTSTTRPRVRSRWPAVLPMVCSGIRTPTIPRPAPMVDSSCSPVRRRISRRVSLTSAIRPAKSCPCTFTTG